MSEYDDLHFSDFVTVVDVCKITSLPDGCSYTKLLNFINDQVLASPNPRDFQFDYHTARMLLNQAQEKGISFAKNNTKKLDYIYRCYHREVSEKLFEEEGYSTHSNQLVSIFDSHLYQTACQYYSINSNELREKRRQFIDQVLSDDNIFQEIKDHPEYISNYDSNYYYNVVYNNSADRYQDFSEEIQNKLVVRSYLNLVAQYFFGDVYENAYMNSKQMLTYTRNSEYKILLDNFSFYLGFIMLVQDENYEEIKDFYLEYRDKFTPEMYYDDFRTLRDASYQDLIDGCTSFTLDSPLYNDEYSNKYGVDVYYLDGQDFHAFVRSTFEINKYDNQPLTEDQIHRLGHSFTYIGTENIATFGDPNRELTMIYSNINYQNIEHVSHHDSGTSEYGTVYENELHTPHSLLEKAYHYPEIFIRDTSGIQPTALLCYDEPTEWDIRFSKQFQLPIVLVNTEKYPLKNERANNDEKRFYA